MSKLESASHISVIIVCALASVALLSQWGLPKRQPSRTHSQTDLAGKPINLKGVQWGSTRLTVVVAIGTQCGYCQASVPFYRHLAEAAASTKAGIGLVFCSQEPTSSPSSASRPPL